MVYDSAPSVLTLIVCVFKRYAHGISFHFLSYNLCRLFVSGHSRIACAAVYFRNRYFGSRGNFLNQKFFLSRFRKIQRNNVAVYFFTFFYRFNPKDKKCGT